MTYVLLSEDPNILFSSVNFPLSVNLSTSTANLLSITILQANNLYQHAIQLGDSVLVGDKIFYSTDFVSITNFNVPEPIPLTFLERWAG